MSSSDRWTWDMARGGPVRAGRRISDGSILEADEEWRYAVEKLHRLQDMIFRIVIERDGTSVLLSGNLASEQVKRLVGEIVVDYAPETAVIDRLEVTAPFRSAERDDLVVEMKGSLTSDAAPTSSSTVSVERYPRISSKERPAVGQKFRFEVDLRLPQVKTKS